MSTVTDAVLFPATGSGVGGFAVDATVAVVVTGPLAPWTNQSTKITLVGAFAANVPIWQVSVVFDNVQVVASGAELQVVVQDTADPVDIAPELVSTSPVLGFDDQPVTIADVMP